jgi:TolB protein
MEHLHAAATAHNVNLRRALLWLGALLAVGTAAAAPPAIYYVGLDATGWQIRSMRTDGSHDRPLTRLPHDVVRISCFANANRLLATTSQGEVGVVDQEGQFTKVALGISVVLDAALSPDGTRMAFSFARAQGVDTNDIFLANVDGSNIRKVIAMPALQHEPVWSPDGNALYFPSGEGGAVHDLWKVSLVNGAVEQLTVGSRYNFDVAVAADGRLAFSSNRSGDYELWLAEPQRAPEQLTQHAGLDARPSFSADGTTLIYEREDQGTVNVWRMELDTRKTRQLTHSRRGARSAVWCEERTP